MSFRLVTFAGALVSSLNPINQVFPWIFAFVSLPGRRSKMILIRGFYQNELGRGGGRMRIAITFRNQPEHERRDNEYDYSSLRRREAEFLPHFIEFETPALFNHEYLRSFPCVYCCAAP